MFFLVKHPAQYPQHLAEACERVTKALKAEADFQRKARKMDREELRRLHRAVDSASEAYLLRMREYIEFFQNARRR